MKKVKNKDKEINLDQVIAKYRPVIGFRVKRSLGHSNPDWEDVVNEIILNVIEKVKKQEFRGESSIGTFIYTITSRRIVDYIRRKSKVLRHIPEPNPLPAPHELIENKEKVELIENKEKVELIANAIKKLKPKYREILYLYYYRDMTREEVAQKLGISPRRVSERVNYSRNLLRKILKK